MTDINYNLYIFKDKSIFIASNMGMQNFILFPQVFFELYLKKKLPEAHLRLQLKKLNSTLGIQNFTST